MIKYNVYDNFMHVEILVIVLAIIVVTLVCPNSITLWHTTQSSMTIFLYKILWLGVFTVTREIFSKVN